MLYILWTKSLYRFFSNEASEQEEKQILAWIDEHPDHRKILLKERRVFDATILFAEEKSLYRKPRKE
ncbi:MAG: hypothetical protein LIP01_00540 [Tannerellaceae bacterium]|nr:hypothetical protein [Tannerellaceae bacterium]